MKNVAILILGSNLGNKELFLQEALQKIEVKIGTIISKSFILETEPWGFTSKNTFLNQAVIIETLLTPIDLLNKLQEIEKKLGRLEKTKNTYQDRVIDIDIVTYNSIHFFSKRLTIPHKLHLEERDFSKQLLEDLNQ